MNLIEQLGGYAKLKPHFITTDAALGYTHVYLHGNSHYCFLDDRIDYIIPERAILIKDVINALLEHRRQHNIFEPDDYIIHDGELKVFAMWSSAVEGCAYIGYAYAENGEMAHKDEFRHATPEEIKAGRRL